MKTANKFSDLRAKMTPSAREEALRRTQFMLTESSELLTADFSAQREDAAKQGYLAQHLLLVKERDPLTGDEMSKKWWFTLMGNQMKQ